MPSRIIALSALLAFTLVLPAQAPKEKPAAPRPKFSAQQIAEAERRLAQANCGLHHEELPPVVPNGPPGKGPVDVIAFPADTTDAELAKLIPLAQRLPNLRTVDLGHVRKVTAKGMKEIAKLSDLKAIFLDGCDVDADVLKELIVLKDLVWLDLSRSTVKDDDLKVLSDYPALHTLSLVEVKALSTAGVAHLQKLVRLRALHISVDADPPGMAEEIAKLDRLVELRAFPVGDDEVEQIGKLVRLQVLDLNNDRSFWRGERDKAPPANMNRRPEGILKNLDALKKLGKRLEFRGSITAMGFPHILKCTDLRVLRLAGHRIDVNGSGLDRLEFLQELELSGTDFTDDGVAWLGRLKSLKKLWLSGTGITNEGVKGLAVAGGLELVALDALPLTDEVLEHLARNRKLKDLTLNETRIGLTDKKTLYAFGRLERLELRTTNITDGSILNLIPVKTLKLVDVRFNCPNVTPQGAATLEREMPGTKVITYSCDVAYWPGGGGVPIPRATREPDLSTRNPANRPSASLTPMPPKTSPKAAPPPVRTAPLTGSGKQ